MAPVTLTDATKNWLKAAFALKHLKKGLLPFINHEISTFHNNLITTHGACNQCTTENILKCTTKNACFRRGRTCLFHDSPLKQYRPCPNSGICDNIRDAIAREHIKGEPMWTNTDATKWSSDAWEVAKCFLPPRSNNAASSKDTDCTGILSLCLHCLPLRALVGHVTHDLEKNRDNRNALMHSGRQELSDADRSSFIQDAVRLLATYQTPVSLHTQECIDTLNQIDFGGLILTTDDILEVLETKVEAIRKKQGELETELQESNENTAENAVAIAYHNTKLDAYKDEIKKLDDALKATNSILQNLDETDVVKQLQNKMENIRKHNEIFCEQINKQIETLQTKVKEHDELHKNHAEKNKVHDENIKEHSELHKVTAEMIKVHAKNLKEQDEQHKELEQRMDNQETTVGQKLDAVVTRVETLEQINSRFPKIEDSTQENSPGREQGQQSGNANSKMGTDDDIPAAADSQDARKIRGRKRLRDHLIKKYEENYSDMCLAPPTDMWADFVEHYHEPDMRQIEIPGKSQKQKGEKEGNIAIQSYKQVFHRADQPCRKIYVKGDAGSGKSVFCQRMVNRWCEIHSPVKTEDGLSKSDTVSDEQNDIEMLHQFEFLFYIELRYATKLSDIEAMIRENILNNNKQLLDQLTDVLENESEKCLVLCDGLDEWSAPEGSAVSQFVTHGLPDRKSYNWTILTTTRPCKLETIRPKPGDMDQLIKLSGLTEHSVEETVKSVVDYLNSNYLETDTETDTSPKSPEQCSEYLQNVDLPSQILTLPIILKYLVCIWFEGGNVGKTKCDMYAAMLDLFLRYGKAHTKFHQNTNQTINQDTLPDCDTGTACNDLLPGLSDTGTACNDLPPGLRSRNSCQGLIQPLYKLSKLAFHTLFCKDRSSSLVFDSYSTNIHGLSEPEVDTWLTIGLLSKDRVNTSCIKNEKMISFPHKTIQEFLAAVYMSMHTDPDTVVLPIVKEICGTVDMVLEMSQVLVFLSGMAPTVLTTISRHISQVVSADGDIQRYRNTITRPRDNTAWYRYTARDRVHDIQRLMVNCIKESVDAGLTNIQVHIQDMILVQSVLSTCTIENMFRFNKSQLISFCVDEGGLKQLKTMPADTYCQHLSTLNKLEVNGINRSYRGYYAVELQLNNCNIDGDEVVSIIRSSMNTLKVISLNVLSFSLSTSKHLFQSLPRVLDLQLTSVALNIHELQQVQQLQGLYLKGTTCNHCSGPCQLDLSKLTQLQRLRIEPLHVDTVQINTSQLEECVFNESFGLESYPTNSLIVHGDGRHLRRLTLEYLSMKHDQLEQLLLVVKLSVGLREITLDEISCDDCTAGCTWRIDLSQHTQLEMLVLNKLHVSEVQINTTQLQYCTIDRLRQASSAYSDPGSEEFSLTLHGGGKQLRDLTLRNIFLKHEQLEQLMLFVKQATRLEWITLNDVTCGDCTAGCTCQLDLSQHTQLWKLELQNLHVSEVQINTTQLQSCTIDGLRPASSAPSEPGSEEISLMFHGDGEKFLIYLKLTNMVMKHEQLEQMMYIVKRAPDLDTTEINAIKCNSCGSECSIEVQDITQCFEPNVDMFHIIV